MTTKPLAELRSPRLPFHPSLLIAPFALIFWVIALAGAGATHQQCNQRIAGEGKCNAESGLVWATVFFEFATLAPLFGLLPTKFGSGLRVMFAALLTIPTTLFMTHAQTSMVALYTMNNTVEERQDKNGEIITVKVKAPSGYQSAYQTAAAGATLVIIINLVLIIYLLLEVPDSGSCCAGGAAKQPAPYAAPTVPAAPAAPTVPAASQPAVPVYAAAIPPV